MTEQMTQSPPSGGAPAALPPAPATKLPFVPPVLTNHGSVAAVTQKNHYVPFFQEMIVAETSP